MEYTLTLTRRMLVLLAGGSVLLFMLLFVFGLALGRSWPASAERCVNMIVSPQTAHADSAQSKS